MGVIKLTLYTSDEIPCMVFDCPEDVDNFDKILRSYVSNPVAIEEFHNAERQYASLGAVKYNIDDGTFHFNLQGPYSEELIGAAENMVDLYGVEGDPGDCYTPVMNYILGKLYPNVDFS